MTAPAKTRKVLDGTDLGTTSFASPLSRRNPRRDTLNPEAIQAIRLNNELAGDDGLKYEAPGDGNQTGVPTVTSLAKSLFTGSSASKPAASPVQGRTIVIDGRTMSLANAPADKDSFKKPRRWDKTKRDQLSNEE